MSEPIFEASVRMRVDLTEVEKQAQAGLQKTFAEAEKKAQAALDAAVTRAVSARQELTAVSTEASKVEKRLAELRQLQGSVDPATFSRSTAAEDLPIAEARSAALIREKILKAAANAEAQRGVNLALKEKEAVEERIAAAAAGPPLATQRGGLRDTLGDLLRSRSSGLAGIAGLAGRAGLAGAAFGVAFQGIGELQQSLRATGDEAFTAEGKVRNLGAELLTGNLIGGIKALAATPKAQLVGDLPERIAALKAVKAEMDPLIISEERLIQVGRQGADATGQYLASLAQFGKLSLETAKDLEKVTEQLLAQTRAAEASGAALASFAQRREQGGPEQLLPARAPGGQFQRTGVPEGADFGSPEANRAAGAANLAAANQIRESVIARIPIEKERLAAELAQAVIIVEQKKTAAAAVQGTLAHGQALADLEAAQTDVVLKTRAVKDAAEAAAQASRDQGNSIREAETSLIENRVAQAQQTVKNKLIVQSQAREVFEGKREEEGVGAAWTAYRQATIAVTEATRAAKVSVEEATAAAQEMAATVREAQASAIADPAARSQADLKNLKIAEKLAQEAFDEETKGTPERNQAYAKLIVARKAVVRFQNEAAEAAKSESESAAAKAQSEAEAAAQSARSATETRLANNISQAELEGNKANVIKFTNVAIDYYRAIRDNESKSAEERETARSTVISLQAGLKEGDGDRDAIRQARLQNAQEAAERTPGSLDNRRAFDAWIIYWQDKMKSATELEKVEIAGKIAALRFDSSSATGNALTEQRLANRRARAEQTEGLADNRKAINNEIAYQKKLREGASALRKAQIDNTIIGLRGELKGLDGKGASAATGGMGTLDFLGISQKLFKDFAGNLLPTGSADAMKGLFSLPGLPGGVGTQDEQVDELRRIRELLERNGAGATVTIEQNFRKPDSGGFEQARFARFAMEEAFNG